MMKPDKTIRAALIMGALLVALSACQKEGPAEQAGKKVDQATEKVGEQIEKVGDDIEDAAKDDKE